MPSKVVPGVILREVETKGTTTRRFEIRWHDGRNIRRMDKLLGVL